MSIIKRKAGSEDIVKSILEFDDVPTEGSHNLVESGSVAQAIGNLGQPLQWKGPATVAQLNAGITGIQPGWTYTLTDAGTLTDGSVKVDVGDEVAWTEDDEWFKVGGDTGKVEVFQVVYDTDHYTWPSFSEIDAAVTSGKSVCFVQTNPAGAKTVYWLTFKSTASANLYFRVVTGTSNYIDIYQDGSVSSGNLLVTAVKYKQNQTLYLGSNLFDFSELNYNPSVWSVDSVNGTISYLGGIIAPIIMEVSTDNDNSYMFECVTSDYQQQTDMFRVAIGDGYKNDPYNGTDNIAVGSVSDGGYLKIYPKLTTNTFTLSSIEFRKKVSLGEADKTELYEGRNVNSGNSDESILDGKWNVAVGPTAYTQNKAVGLSRSIAIGYQAQALLNSGLQNIAIGTFAQNLLKYAERNVAIGSDCLYAVTFADDCIAIGKTAMSGNPSQVSWNNSATWQHLQQIVAIGNDAARIANGQTASKSVYIGYSCAADGIGNKCTSVGADIRNQYGKTNCTAIGYGARCDKSNQSVIGNADTTETKVYGNLIVEGTDSVKRRIVFNEDNTCSWEVVS